MIIRKVFRQDRGAIENIIISRNIFKPEEIDVAMELVDAAIEDFQSGYYVYCAIDMCDNVVGYICFGPVPMTVGTYDLYWIVAHPLTNGVGSELINFMEVMLSKMGGRCVYVETSSTENYKAAMGFYEGHGYTIVCELSDFYSVGDNKLIYRKDLRAQNATD